MKIAILGSGPFGLSLSINFSKHQLINHVVVYSRNDEIVAEINNYNCCMLEEIKLSKISKKIRATSDLLNVLDESDILFITVNSTGLINFINEIEGLHLDLSKKFFVICTKGIDNNGFFSDKIKGILKINSIAFLLGPSFANEIACGEKTCVNLIYHDIEYAEYIISQIVDDKTNVKIFPMNDYIGAQLCSTMKNICAIYLGIAKGYGIKHDYIAVMFKFFIDEMIEAINFYNGDEKTIFELCGIGDLFLTSTSFESRNYNFGYQVGITKSVQNAYELCKNYYPEGYFALNNLIQMNKKNSFNLKICNQIYEVLYVDKSLHSKSKLFELEFCNKINVNIV
jgi:glycerol-3-phosphate dehydrogenase (NAD(P)+)